MKKIGLRCVLNVGSPQKGHRDILIVLLLPTCVLIYQGHIYPLSSLVFNGILARRVPLKWKADSRQLITPKKLYLVQWRIYIVKFWTRPPPPLGSKFFQFHAVFGKIWKNRMLAPPPPLESWRPLLGEILDPPLNFSWCSGEYLSSYTTFHIYDLNSTSLH